MKKIIMASAITLGVSCAFLLAQADDTQTANPPSDSSSQNSGMSQPGQQAGSAAAPDTSQDNSNAMSSDSSKTTTTETTKMSKKDQWANASECTDSTGMTYKKGTKSFRRCVDAKRAAEHAQMNKDKSNSEQGGTSSSDSSNNY